MSGGDFNWLCRIIKQLFSAIVVGCLLRVEFEHAPLEIQIPVDMESPHVDGSRVNVNCATFSTLFAPCDRSRSQAWTRRASANLSRSRGSFEGRRRGHEPGAVERKYCAPVH